MCDWRVKYIFYSWRYKKVYYITYAIIICLYYTIQEDFWDTPTVHIFIKPKGIKSFYWFRSVAAIETSRIYLPAHDVIEMQLRNRWNQNVKTLFSKQIITPPCNARWIFPHFPHVIMKRTSDFFHLLLMTQSKHLIMLALTTMYISPEVKRASLFHLIPIPIVMSHTTRSHPQ